MTPSRRGLDDLPQRSESHQTAAAGETAFRAAIAAGGRFTIQQSDEHDYGTDFQIEAIEHQSATNFRIHVQLKSTTNPLSDRARSTVSVARANLNYLLGQPNSIYVCFHVPSARLSVRFAEDVFREYEHRGTDWRNQESITVRFSDDFDAAFQSLLHSRVVASSRTERDIRLAWAVARRGDAPRIIRDSIPRIEVPTAPDAAHALLLELYERGEDRIISTAFEQFQAVLGSGSPKLDMALLAEINLSVNHLAHSRERVQQAIETLSHWLDSGEIEPGSVHYCVGTAQLGLNNLENARNSYLCALPFLESGHPPNDTARCLKNLGSVLEKMGEEAAAKMHYERALQFDPLLAEAHLALAQWHRRNTNDPVLELAHLDEVVRRSDSAVDMLSVQGWRLGALFRSGQISAAFRDVRAVVSHAEALDWVWPWCANHIARHGAGSTDGVRHSANFWREYLRVHPEVRAAERELLKCVYGLRMADAPTGTTFAEFRDSAVRFIDEGEPLPEILWDRIGHWAQLDGDWREAEVYLRRAFGLDRVGFAPCLCAVLNALGEATEVVEILAPMAAAGSLDSFGWFQLGSAQSRLGNFTTSAVSFGSAIELDEAYATAWFNLGGAHWSAGEYREARDAWHEAVSRFPEHELAATVRSDFGFLINE